MNKLVLKCFPGKVLISAETEIKKDKHTSLSLIATVVTYRLFKKKEKRNIVWPVWGS